MSMMSTKQLFAPATLVVGDKVQHDFSKNRGVVKETRKEYEGYNYLIDWTNDDGSVLTMWVKREVLVKV